MSEHVWVSIAAENRRRHFNFGWSEAEYFRDKVIALEIDSKKGLPMPADRFPKVLETVGKGSRLPKKLPDYINWTLPVVSEKLADVLRQGDLGMSNFYPVSLYRRDKSITIDETFFILNIAVCKEALLPDRSSNLAERALGPAIKTRMFDIRSWAVDDDIVVGQCAMEGPDIWVDPMLPSRTFFVSDQMYQSLKKAKLAKILDFKRCRTVG